MLRFLTILPAELGKYFEILDNPASRAWKKLLDSE